MACSPRRSGRLLSDRVLTSTVDHYRAMQRLAAVAGVGLRRRRTLAQLAAFVVAMQVLAARQGAASVPEMLEEQGIPSEAVGAVTAAGFAGDTPNGAPLIDLLDTVTAPDAPTDSLLRLVLTLIADAGRQAQLVAETATPAVTGHVRYVNPPCCGRCAILAGRFYRWSDGFLRHPRCDCVMVPSTQRAALGLVDDPMALFRNGQIRGLSEADTEAVEAGAALSQVVNVRRKAAGLTRAGRVLTRGSGRFERPTPEGILAFARHRAEAIRLLERYGYLT